MARAPASVRAVPGQPGVYVNEATGEVFKLVEFRDDDIYDTEDLASGSQSAGTKIQFFQTVSDKFAIDTNIDTARRLSKGQTMVINRVWVDIPLYVGNTNITVNDIKRVTYGSYAVFKVNKIIIAEGGPYKFSPGWGLTGATTENNTSIVANGVAASASKRPLEKAHYITDDHDLTGELEFQARTWDTDATTAPNLSTVMHVRAGFGGLISTAATK